MLRYVEMVLVPWLEKRRVEISARSTQKALLLLNVFKSHSTQEVLNKLSDHHVPVRE